jgi:hypothetical protein
MRMMLTRHPDLAIPPESLFIPRAWEIRRRYITRRGFDGERMMRDILSSGRAVEWGVPPGLLLERVRRIQSSDFGAVIRVLYGSYAALHGKWRWGDKTPSYLLALPLLSSLFPDARFIHMIRDGRNVALSLWQAPFGPSSLGRAAHRWAHQVRKGCRLGLTLGPDRYVEVRYERLVEQPEATLQRVCNFIDLDFRGEMLNYQTDWRAALPPRVHGLLEGLDYPPRTDLRDWRSELSGFDLAMIEAVQARMLDRLGYERVSGRPISARLHRAGVLISVLARRVYFGLERAAFHLFRRTGLPRPRAW